VTLLIGILTLFGLLPATAPDAAAQTAPGRLSQAASACSTATIDTELHLPNVTVRSAQADTSGSFTVPGGGPPLTGLPSFCDVSLAQTDQAGNKITIEVWLPFSWNSSFQGVGGGGYSCGVNWFALAAAIKQQYAAASTDCGHSDFTGAFALNPDRTLNEPLIVDFASVGIHDMTVTGKAVTIVFYTHQAKFSYFNGCSTGGREGLMEAQQYPADYNGIVSGAPAINWTRFIPAEIWPQLVMKDSNDFLPACKQTAFTESVINACDALDGVSDGIIADPARCDWNPLNLVGLQTPCGTITRTDAEVVAKIWAGPVSTTGQKLWFGLEPGAPFAGLAGTTTANGTTTAAPFPIAVSWLGTWVQQNPSWDWHTLTDQRFDQLFGQSIAEFSDVIATDNPNLSAFERTGGKIIIWHGLADQLIFPQGTINYYQRVQQAMGGTAKTDEFARLFLAPGATHCGSGVGPAPTDPLHALVSWVTHGKAPAQLAADLVDPATGVTTMSRILCTYPATAKYTGHGSTNDAKNYRCT
jgi:feruloyl esterase